MGLLTYGMLTSLDGYTAGPEQDFDWATPTPRVHRHANVGMRDSSLEIYGRRMYETMKVWQDIDDSTPMEPGPWRDAMVEFAELWRDTDKLVVSTTLDHVDTPRTTLADSLDAATLDTLKSERAGGLTISGPTIAADALRSGLVDEVSRYIAPVVVGGGTPWWPAGVPAQLELLASEQFDKGWVYLRYRVVR
jgi:dihydrofolate reductase